MVASHRHDNIQHRCTRHKFHESRLLRTVNSHMMGWTVVPSCLVPPGKLNAMFRYLQLTTVVAVALTTSTPVLQAADKETAGAPKAVVTLKEGTWKDVQTLIAERPGKIVVVDIWSTSCLPCMKEYPELVKLQKTYPKQIVCVGFNIDYVGIKSKPPEYYRPRAEKFLQKHEADFSNFLSSVDAIEIFDQLDLNSIPAVLVFGKDGKLGKRFDDTLLKPGKVEAFTYQQDINPFIAKLLKK